MAAPIVELPKPENTAPRPEKRSLDLPPVRDAGIRLALIPAFGIVIPYFVGYFGALSLKSPSQLDLPKILSTCLQLHRRSLLRR